MSLLETLQKICEPKSRRGNRVVVADRKSEIISAFKLGYSFKQIASAILKEDDTIKISEESISNYVRDMLISEGVYKPLERRRTVKEEATEATA